MSGSALLTAPSMSRGKAEGLPADLKLDAQTIAEKYGDAWTDFMAWRVAQIFARFKEAAHRLAPGTQFSAYSGYQTPDNPSRYGVDWAHVGRLRACDRVGCGYGRPVEAIPKTLQALNGIPALFGALMTPYDTKELTPQIPITKACLLRLALDATGGVLVYDRMPMDGRTWLAIAETTRLTADFEEAFLHGKRGVLPGCDEAAVQVLRDGAVALVCVMNNGSKAVEYRIPLPVEAGAGTEYYTGAKVAAGEMARCPLPPGESAVYVLRK